MELALFFSAFAICYPGCASQALLLRTGLVACQRFSPRAALALASVASLASSLASLLFKKQTGSLYLSDRLFSLSVVFLCGAAGRSALIMYTACCPSSLALLRLQAIPLYALCLVCILPARRASRRGASLLSLALPALADGFLGCGGFPLFCRLFRAEIIRRDHLSPPDALLLEAAAQSGALLLSLLSGGAPVLPPRLLASLCAGASLGAFVAESAHQNKRSPSLSRIRAALGLYGMFSALSGVEQAFF